MSSGGIYPANQRQGFMSSTLMCLPLGALSMPDLSGMDSVLARTMMVPSGIADPTSRVLRLGIVADPDARRHGGLALRGDGRFSHGVGPHISNQGDADSQCVVSARAGLERGRPAISAAPEAARRS